MYFLILYQTSPWRRYIVASAFVCWSICWINNALSAFPLFLNFVPKNSVKLYKIPTDFSDRKRYSEKYISFDEWERWKPFHWKLQSSLRKLKNNFRMWRTALSFCMPACHKEYWRSVGKKDDIWIAYKLIDKIFDWQLLHRYSWTRFSRSDSKKSFREWKILLECFPDIVKAADTRFTEDDCEVFFKNKVLKVCSYNVWAELDDDELPIKIK